MVSVSANIIKRLIGLEERQYRAALARFQDAWLAGQGDAAYMARIEAAVTAQGYAGPYDDFAALDAWCRARGSPRERAEADALWAVVVLATRRPDDTAAIRVALATLAPFLGRNPDTPTHVLLDALTVQTEAARAGA
jgi:hypothetical protein